MSLAIELLGAPSSDVWFEVPSACGTEAGFVRQLEEFLGGDAGQAMPASLRIEGPDAQGLYRLQLVIDEERRELTDADCTTLLRSAAVIAAAAVTPAAEALPEPEPGPESSPPESPPPESLPPESSEPMLPEALPEPLASIEPTPVQRPDEPDAGASEVALPTPEPRPRPRPSWLGSIGGGVGIAYGIVPRVGALLELEGGTARGPWGMTFGVRYVPTTREERDGRTAVVMAFGGRVAADRRIVEAFHVALGVDVDWLWGRGENIEETLSEGAWMVSPILELTAVPLRRPRARIEVSVVGRVAALQPRFEVAGFGTIYQPPRFGVLATISGFWRSG